MNKAITEGIIFQPPAFADGLDVWSSGDGTPGSDTYDNAANAAFVPADQDFGGALEILKNAGTTKIRYTGETPILPGCYLQIRARVKCISGSFPSVRIAAFAGAAGGANLAGVVETGPATTLSAYGEVVEVSAIIGTGARGGVDMPWGREALYAHVGLDFTGANGGVLRVDDIEVEDVTGVFAAENLGAVNVVDFGAVGDATTDNVAAFEAADAAAQGREVFVPAGIYRLGGDMTFENRVRFEGTVTMRDEAKFLLLKNYDLANYQDAFGDEVLAFKKAFQVLMDFSDHESLDMNGRRIRLTEPLDMQAAVANRTSFESRRLVRNGQIQLDPSPAWEPDVVVAQASYSTSNPMTLSNVANVANIAVGSLVEGVGVGREIYVTARNVAAQTLTLTQALYGGAGTQNFTFTRFKYAFDFSGFDRLSQFTLDSIDFQCGGFASAIMLARDGSIFHVKDCFITRPKQRGITSPGRGCQGMMIDRCNWFSEDAPLPTSARTTVGFNANANDVKVRDNRVVRFKHFAIIGGGGSAFTGNHWFQDDAVTDGVRSAGVIFAHTNVKAFITGNYLDNSFVEWTNEYEADPDFANQLPFGGLTITGNIFTANDVAPWFNFIVMKPFGEGFYIKGLSVIGNVFKALNGAIDRIDGVDTSFADLDYGIMRNITFEANSFDGINTITMNPLKKTFDQNTPEVFWNVECAPNLPFGGRVRHVEGIVPVGSINNAAGIRVTDFPFVSLQQGPNGSQARITWPEAAKGRILITARMDRPD
ncbi:MAG: glycosyl hydrolase family 28-related protein [Pseudomonadota bacterium]